FSDLPLARQYARQQFQVSFLVACSAQVDTVRGWWGAALGVVVSVGCFLQEAALVDFGFRGAVSYLDLVVNEYSFPPSTGDVFGFRRLGLGGGKAWAWPPRSQIVSWEWFRCLYLRVHDQ